jgi:hypothetical protein
LGPRLKCARQQEKEHRFSPAQKEWTV